MMLPKYGRFVGCEIDVVCFNVSQPSVVKTFAQLVLKEGSGIKASAEVAVAVQTYVSANGWKPCEEKRLMWDAAA